ncbi:MAG: DUF1385 domain-containing protein [Clostridia bacterium]|nr:DUF1385 domain-containing protein [Clostridia bacterium]
MKDKGKSKYCSIGGQALIEGIMMKGPDKTAVCVRMPDKSISTEYMQENNLKDKYPILKAPIIRGLGTFIDSMKTGYKALMISAEKSGFEDEEQQTEPTKFEKWLDEKFGDKIMNVVMVISTVLGIGIAVLLFFMLPTILYNFISPYLGTPENTMIIRSVCEGLLRVIIFMIYLFFCSNISYIKRVFQYHGAEHKTIFCYEANKELTVENVKEFKRFHPRCGTSFIIISLIVGVIIGFFIPFENPVLRTTVKLLCLPIVMGLGYEAIRFCGKYDNWFTRIIAAPGLWVQRITTKEPDDEMIEVAIEALNAVKPDQPESCTEKCENDNRNDA